MNPVVLFPRSQGRAARTAPARTPGTSKFDARPGRRRRHRPYGADPPAARVDNVGLDPCFVHVPTISRTLI